jgi:diguanylate cyclase (GGDEF)-like protein
MVKQRSATDILQSALHGAGDVAYIWDLRDDTMHWAGNLDDVFGPDCSDGSKNGEVFNERINIEDLSRRLHSLSRHLQGDDVFDCEYRLRRDNGEFVWVHDKGSAEIDDDGVPVFLAGVLRPVTKRKQQETLLEQKANYDELTGQLNRSRLREALQNTLSYNARYDVTGAYLAIGIDKLSIVNDAYGHKAADAVIVAASQRIERCLRVSDYIGRIGGDRFGAILSSCKPESVVVTAEKILESFRNSAIETPSGPIHITVSVGGVAFPGFIQTAHDAMTAAESALQEGKQRGRNCYVESLISEEQRLSQRKNIDIGEQIQKALADDRMAFAYQPVVDSKTHETRYYETLLRMHSETHQVIAAGVFVPVAEKLGLMRKLDRRALDLAIKDLRDFPDITLALNISSLTVTDQSWLRALVGELKVTPEIASRLIVEITETAALEDFDVSARFVAQIRDLGCKVALDDFGSGYTSFRHLKSLTVDVVKIDGAFVKDVASNSENQLFIRTLLGLAEGFGLETVAECVETADEAWILRNEGANYLQGYYFGKPDLKPEWRNPVSKAS